MKKLLSISLGLIAMIITSVALAAPVSEFLQIDMIATTGGMIGVGVVTSFVMPSGVLGMAIQKEIWETGIIDNLYKDNKFLAHAYNADENVLSGKVVHISRANSNPSAEKNRSSLPATVTKRNAEDITYALAEWTTDPERIEHAEKIELSYDKLQSILHQHFGVLNDAVAEDMIYAWLTSTGGVADTALQIRTTGSAAVAHTGSATGNRKILTPDDIKAARTLMNKNNIPTEGRVALIDSDMMDQLMSDSTLKNRDRGMELDLKNGVVARLYGFDLMERSSVAVFDNAGTPVAKAPGAAGAAADNAAALFWHPSCVERALGTVKVFDETDSPIYYGDIYSALLRFGGRIRRKQGIVACIQAATA